MADSYAQDSEQEQEKKHCPCLSGEFYCGKLNTSLTARDTSNFCDGDFSSCPAYSNQPVLDEKLCDQITTVFDNACVQTADAMREMKRAIGAVSQRTGMESINGICVFADQARVDCRCPEGVFSSETQLSCEERCAKILESNINGSLAEICPQAYWANGPSDQPAVSSDDFDALWDVVDQSLGGMMEQWQGMRAGFSSNDRFQGAMQDVTESVISGLTLLERELRDRIIWARNDFVSAVHEAKASADSFPHHVLDYAPIEWTFYDY